MNKQILIGYNSQVCEVVATPLTVSKVRKLGFEVLELESTFERPLSFSVIANKYLVRWTNADYKYLKQVLKS
jgi:hypothetical protein